MVATLGQRALSLPMRRLAGSVVPAPNEGRDRNHGAQTSLSGEVQVRNTPSGHPGLGPLAFSYHSELVHRAEPKSHYFTDHAL